ncbi:MAG: aminopeptidase P family N-terminal domain-containing protein, partial [Gemmatimonadota bacterium]
MAEDGPSGERRPFGRGEYRRRVERVRDRMAGRGLDALLATDPANMNYLTGYDAWSFYVHQAVVLPASGDPVWVGREMDAGAARATTWLPEERVRIYGDEYVQSPEDRHPMD